MGSINLPTFGSSDANSRRRFSEIKALKALIDGVKIKALTALPEEVFDQYHKARIFISL